MRILAPILLAAALLAACAEEQQARPAQPAVATAVPESPKMRPQGVVVGCRSQSGYDFGDAYTNPDNIVVGPLVITNAVYTEPETIREFGGDKIFVLLQPGHRVTLALSQQTYRVASLGYGPLPQELELTPQDGHRVVTFTPCPAERAWSTRRQAGYVLGGLHARRHVLVHADRRLGRRRAQAAQDRPGHGRPRLRLTATEARRPAAADGRSSPVDANSISGRILLSGRTDLRRRIHGADAISGTSEMNQRGLLTVTNEAMRVPYRAPFPLRGSTCHGR